MKILELGIRNFGKLADRKIKLSEGINLIYGENESGKSTVHTFIKSMLFGMERGRGRAAQNDTFSIYEPWENGNYYSGRMRFESGDKTFWIDRNFDKYGKKAELVCADDGEKLSVEDGDLRMLLGGMSESAYDNTVSIGQLKAQPGQSLSAELRNYATNYYASGGGDLNIDAALNQLKERRKEIDKKVKEGFRKKQENRDHIEQEASYIWREIHKIQEDNENLEERIAYRREHQAQKEEPENNRVIDELRPGKWRIHPIEIIAFILAIALVVLMIHRPWNYLVAIVLTLLCLIYTWNRLKVSKKQEKSEPEKILEEITPEEEKVPLERLIWELERGKEELKEKQILYNNLREQHEEMDEMDEQFWELERQRQAIELAADTINELSMDLQKQLTDKMNTLLSEIISEFTDGKYTRLTVGDNLKAGILKDGRKIPIEQVSRGTAEQIYLALRMASAKALQEEEMPVILDDTFVCYDEKRLEHALGWLAENKEQVLIFTCQKREEDALRKLGIRYHKVEM